MATRFEELFPVVLCPKVSVLKLFIYVMCLWAFVPAYLSAWTRILKK